ncbi:YdcF family protein [Methylosinus sp. Ce-a6]|uniref:YdcF family protein n=1 Tax=Methylosinus sp. Ce-a6 TaxID=2172005 RepID=UPI001FCE3CFF|nr:YdcF family protein [Methylosinus sp. Ce-a6]
MLERMPSLVCVVSWAATHTLLVYVFAIIICRFDSFDAFELPSAVETRHVSAAVVFTGSFERIDAGLQLMNSGVVPLLYISGLNANAGLHPSRFVAQFSARNPNIRDLRRLVECCVQWGEYAENTIQNAVETRCWVRRHETPGPLLLITSRLHMARALTALSSELPDRPLIPFPALDPASSASQSRPRVIEYLKYLATIALVHAPSINFRLPIHRSRADGCPP